jgi:Ca-activated chloride channel family protein
LLAIPLLIGVRIAVARRRRPAVRYSSLALVRDAIPRSSRIRRHMPFALLLLALGSLAIAMARPAAIVAVPAGQTTVILAMDVSRSMCATDIAPSRLLAAEAAAQQFIERQGANTRIGIVAFAGFAEIVQAPTTDKEVLQDVVQTLATGRRTAIGSAILESIDAISEIDPSVPRSQPEDTPAGLKPAPVPKGAYSAAIIVLLTDGASNAGPEPVDAAQQAADRGLKVYTIGFGTDDPGARNPRCGAQFIGGEPGDSFDPFGGFGGFGGGGGGGGQGFRREIDEGTLTAIADTTGAKYYPAQSADQLQDVLANLPTNTIFKHEVTELSVIFVAIGALFATGAIFLGQAWRPWP